MSSKHRKKHKNISENKSYNKADQKKEPQASKKPEEEAAAKTEEKKKESIQEPAAKEASDSPRKRQETENEEQRAVLEHEAETEKNEEEEPEPLEQQSDEEEFEQIEWPSENVARRREYRHKRRMRNQFLAYGGLIVLIGVIAAGIVLGVKYLTTERTVRQEEAIQQSQEKQQEKVEEYFASEESISIPESSESIPEEVEPTFEEKLDALVDEIISQMSLEDKVAGLFFVSPENITKVSTAVAAGETTKKALTNYPVGGVIYQGKNIQNEKQIMEVLSKTALYAEDGANHNIFLAVSEEGGSTVTVAAKNLGTRTDSAEDIGAGGDPQKAKTTGNVIGEYLNHLGFNLDFAPVADLNLVEKSALGKRSYGADVSLVSGCVTAMMQGLEEEGILPAVIQFPGTGSTTAKTENGLSSSNRTAEEFRAEEFQVFAAAIEAGAKMIMVSHMSAPGLDESNTPCSMSETVVTGILRRELGFQGVIISEPMNRKAIADYYSADEAAVSALKAGCDMILVPEDFEKAYKGVLEAVQDGRISEERINDSLKRVYRIKYTDKIEEE